MGTLDTVTDETFEEKVVGADKPVLVDFWAPWCQPCLRLAPVVEELAETYKDKVNFFKMDVENNQTIPAKFGIQSIPTLILFKQDNVLATKIGGDASKAQLAAFLDSHL